MSLLGQLSRELELLVARTAPGVVGVEHGRGQGSGVVLTGDGYVLTNAHVVAGAAPGPGSGGPGRRGGQDGADGDGSEGGGRGDPFRRGRRGGWGGRADRPGRSDRRQGRGGAGGGLRVRLPGGEVVAAELVGSDPRTDVAVLRVDATSPACAGLHSLPLAAGRLAVGQLVLAIGNPLRFERSVSLGVVSAIDRSLPSHDGMFEGLIQTDAAINPGNSGGPLLDAEGAVVGINTAVIPYAQGIGFAIPASTATWVAAVLMRRGEVRRPVLGVAARGEDLEPRAALAAGQPRAVRILQVGDGSPAEQAGLRAGDWLLRADSSPLGSVDDLQRVMVLSEAPEVQLELLRGEGRRSVRVRPRPRTDVPA
jgi:serine protease Do